MIACWSFKKIIIILFWVPDWIVLNSVFLVFGSSMDNVMAVCIRLLKQINIIDSSKLDAICKRYQEKVLLKKLCFIDYGLNQNKEKTKMCFLGRYDPLDIGLIFFLLFFYLLDFFIFSFRFQWYVYKCSCGGMSYFISSRKKKCF